MKTQKKFSGRTAYSFVRHARVTQMQAGNMEVLFDTGHTLRCDGNTIVLRDVHGIAAILEASEKALKKLDALEAECG